MTELIRRFLCWQEDGSRVHARLEEDHLDANPSPQIWRLDGLWHD
jgi:hypothetical protein